MTDNRDRKRLIRQRAARDAVSYNEARRRFLGQQQPAPATPPPAWYLPPGTHVVTPERAAELAEAMRLIYSRRFPFPAQVAELPEETQRFLAEEVEYVRSRSHVGFRLGDLRRDHPDGRWTYRPRLPYPSQVVPDPVSKYNLAEWAAEPDENFLVPPWKIGTSATRGRAPDGTRIPRPSTPEWEATAAEVLGRVERLAPPFLRDVRRLCRHQGDEAKRLFRHGRAFTPGLQEWDGGEFCGADGVALVALGVVRAVIGQLVGISPWPQVEAWEAQSHDGEHDEDCLKRWARLLRRSRRALSDTAVAVAGVGETGHLVFAQNQPKRSRELTAGRIVVAYDTDGVVASLLSHCRDRAR